MITKQDILSRAAEWQLRPSVVEKDYVLGWILTAIATNANTKDNWIFKGGTCIKKCYFETYRFSEDLDFSLLPEARYSQEELKETLEELVVSAGSQSGIVFPLDKVEVKESRNKQNLKTFEGKIAYQGPLNVPTHPRILFDITQHEAIVDKPVRREIFHPYPDQLPTTSVRSMKWRQRRRVRFLSAQDQEIFLMWSTYSKIKFMT
ncbi:nucleotidyl transferase AbiEii/AbiGii toxin family protein [Patescibacteria group bacterium]|nr:nucleotidyl transferase AbiEii/AbiGii toxin family protein [Patescibacteria group bacterium]MBP9710236.1 nucleotidyl transferase AbiEii/AbiGii toxin family protein [Patescibacteria group bacterium]